MDEIVVDPRHPLSRLIQAALLEGRARNRGTHEAMAHAVRAVLEAEPAMTITDAYSLVNGLWVR